MKIMGLKCSVLGHDWPSTGRRVQLIARLYYQATGDTLDGYEFTCSRCGARKVIPDHEQYLKVLFGRRTSV